MRWQIAGFQIHKAVNPNLDMPDPYTGFADGGRVILNGVLNLGPQIVEPGSFRWNGNNFTADLSHSYASQIQVVSTNPAKSNDNSTIDKSGFPKTLAGKISVKDGLVCEMTVDQEGRFSYEYDSSAQLPVGIPSKISNGQQTFKIQKLVFAGESGVDEDIFNPERYVVANLRMIEVISNNVATVKPKQNKQANKIELAAEKVVYQKRQAKRPTAILLISSAIALGVFWVGVRLWKRR